MKTMHNTLRFSTLLALAFAGCGSGSGERTIKPYKMEMQQGNVVTPTMGPSVKSESTQAASARQKAADDSLQNEKAPGLFERTLEMIGF